MFRNFGEKKLNERVIVTRGHLMMWQSLLVIFAANSLLFASDKMGDFRWPMTFLGLAFVIFGIFGLGRTFGHAWIQPATLQERDGSASS